MACKNAQKMVAIFVNFVHTYLQVNAIITLVNPPNTLYSFFATPHKKTKYLLRKGQLVAAVLFTFRHKP